MALAHYKPVAVRPVRTLRVVTQYVKIQRSEDVRSGQRASRVTGPRLVNHLDAVTPDALGNRLEFRDELAIVDFQVRPPGSVACNRISRVPALKYSSTPAAHVSSTLHLRPSIFSLPRAKSAMALGNSLCSSLRTRSWRASGVSFSSTGTDF